MCPPNIKPSNIKSLIAMTARSHSRKNTTLYEVRLSDRGEHHYQQYRIGNQLGKGGFANVYEITKEHEVCTNAVKIILKTDRHGKSDPLILEKVKSQVALMKAAALNNEGVVQYKHHFADGSATYIIMEHCSNGDLSAMMKMRKVLTEPEVRYFVAQMVAILTKLKKQNIVHRDVKPGNFFLNKQMRLKLGDFGLATFNDELFRKKKSVCGTPNYLAPEVIERKSYGFEVDLWAIGIIMYTMLMGIPPFEAKTCEDTYQNIRKCQVRFKSHTPISQEAKSLIVEILKHDMNKRIPLEQVMRHPFMAHYPIPDKLEPERIATPPSSHFIRKYSKKIYLKKTSVDELSQKMEFINVSCTRLDRPKALDIEEMPSAIQKECLSPKIEKPRHPIYKNCPRISLLGDYNKPHKESPVVKKEESLLKKDLEHTLSKLETSVSLKKRARPSVQEDCQPQKKFKYNAQPIHQQTVKKQEERQQTEAKVHSFQPLPQVFSLSQFLRDDNFVKLAISGFRSKLYEPSDLTAIYSDMLKNNQQYGDSRLQNLPRQNKIEWYHITKDNDLIYRMRSNEWGAVFADGSQMLRVNPQKIKYVSSTESNKERNRFQNVKYFKKLSLLTEHRLKVGNKFNENIDPASLSAEVYAESYIQANSVLMVKYSNHNIHFIMAEDHEILINIKEQYISYGHMGKYDQYRLPLGQPEDAESKFMSKYLTALEAFRGATKSYVSSGHFSTADLKLPDALTSNGQQLFPMGPREAGCVERGGKSTWK